jgi:light-regulated signal transduction histidine kinase (bacteriophytochrome)
VFSDVTRLERQRRELERHDRQLADLAAGMRHELRNAVTVIQGNVRWAMKRLDAGELEEARTALRTATDTTDRTTRLMNDFATLAQYGRSMSDPEQTGVAAAARAAWQTTETGSAALATDIGDWTVRADPGRFELLFERSFEFLVANGATTVTVARRDGDLTISGDGEPLEGPPERYFDYADATAHSAVGTALPMVRTLAQVHGWRVDLEAGDRDGVCIVVDVDP